MRVPLTWLAEYVAPPPGYAGPDGGWDAGRLVDRLAMTGTEVEAVHRVGVPDPEGFVVGRVEAVEPHPDADRLVVCRVRTDPGADRTIVCGAPNVAPGQRVPVALPGSELAGGRRIERAELRGVTSEGMILSEAELGLSGDAAEIMVLAEPGAASDGAADPGARLADHLPISETVIELEVTPNRPDCLGIYGVAREVHAVTGGELAPAPWLAEAPEDGGAPEVGELASVRVEAPALCPRFTARAFTDLTVGPSPAWLKARLVAAGQRPINNVVDITNYVMLLTAQPLHAFDHERVPGGELVVRQAGAGESVVTLDGIERELPGGTVAVCDRDGPAAIAGIMGGRASEVGEGTGTVLLEVANWDGPDILRSSRRLGLRSEASSRFEKQLHPALCERAQRIASRLLVEVCGARMARGTIDVAAGEPEGRVVALRSDRTDSLLGMHVPAGEQGEILERLGCAPVEEASVGGIGPPGESDREAVREATAGGPVIWAPIPPDRHYDLTREADLIEEVGRVHGLDRLPATLPAVGGELAPAGADDDQASGAAAGGLSRYQQLRRAAEDTMCALGFDEVVGWSFGLEDPVPGADGREDSGGSAASGAVRIANPLSEEQAVMRTSLLGSLLEAAAFNAARDVDRIALFESGRVYEAGGSAAGRPRETGGEASGEAAALAGEFPGASYAAPARESHRIGALAAGAMRPAGWDGTAPARGFFALKGVLESLAGRLGVELDFEPGGPGILHPGRAAEVSVSGEPGDRLGWIGELHPSQADRHGLGEATAFEVDLAPLLAAATAGRELFEDVTSHPPVTQDLAVVVGEEVPASEVRAAILAAGRPLLRSAEVFDLFRGEQIGAGRKSLALRLEFRADDRTLTDEEVAGLRAGIASGIERIGGSLRE